MLRNAHKFACKYMGKYMLYFIKKQIGVKFSTSAISRWKVARVGWCHWNSGAAVGIGGLQRGFWRCFCHALIAGSDGHCE